jgi:hypothetical protein
LNVTKTLIINSENRQFLTPVRSNPDWHRSSFGRIVSFECNETAKQGNYFLQITSETPIFMQIDERKKE